MKPEPVRHVRVDEHHIAYQVVGTADRDFCIILPSLGTIEVLKDPPALRMLEGLLKHSRLISFDRRGAGLSDPVDDPATLEEQMDDVTAVLDACGSARTVLSAEVEGAMLAVIYAATYPDRVSHLVLTHPMARLTNAPGYDWTWKDDAERLREFTMPLLARWGTGESAAMASPVMYGRDPAFKEWWGRWERLSASPGTLLSRHQLVAQLDVREILPRVQAPTLVLHRPGAAQMNPKHAEYFAERIPNAKLISLPGGDAASFGDGVDAWMEAVEEFTQGTIAPRGAERALATVLFTDIVGSTSKAAALGDLRWRELLGRHHTLVRRELARFRGEERDTAGDGFFATFDGPARAIRCAQVIAKAVGELGLEIRAGVHTGECELHDGKVAGIAVSIGARVAAEAQPGEVLVTGTVKDLVAGSGLVFEPRGERELKGVPGTWHIYAVAEE